MQRLRVIGLLACLLLLAVSGMAQMASTTSIVGTALDNSGAAVPNVNIVAVEVLTGDTYRAVTDVEGNYSFPFVRNGTFKVTASIKGFESVTLSDIIVEINRTVRVDFESPGGSGFTERDRERRRSAHCHRRGIHKAGRQRDAGRRPSTQ